MKSQQNNSNECLFCTRMSVQKRHLFFNLLKALSRELQKLTQKSENDTFQHESNSFKQVLRIIFGEQAIEHQTICEHKKFLTFFSIKLKCSEQVINHLAHKLTQKLAEKNYHLQLLSLQIKNAAESVADGKVSTQEEQQSSFEPLSQRRRPKNKQNKKKSHLPEMRIKVEGEANEGTIHTGSTLTGNSMSYIPIYNSQFNIGEASQSSMPMGNPSNIGYYFPYQIYYSHQSQ